MMVGVGALAMVAGVVLVFTPAAGAEKPENPGKPADAGNPQNNGNNGNGNNGNGNNGNGNSGNNGNGNGNSGNNGNGNSGNGGKPTDPGQRGGAEKTWVCHATGSEANPFVIIPVAANASDGGPDHRAHVGDTFHDSRSAAADACVVTEETGGPEGPKGPKGPGNGTIPSETIEDEIEIEDEVEVEVDEERDETTAVLPDVEVNPNPNPNPNPDPAPAPTATPTHTPERRTEVLPSVVNRPTELAYTGDTSRQLAGLGLVLFGAGTLMVGTSRRKLALI